MKRYCLVIGLAFLAAFASDSWGQSKQPPPSKSSTQPTQSDERGTDKVPLTVKVLPATDAKEQAEKAERDGQEKAILDRKLAFETQRIADYTDRLAWFTVMLFCVALGNGFPDPIDPTITRGRNFPVGVVVTGGRPFNLNFNISAAVNLTELNFVHHTGRSFFLGYVRFRDILGNNYITGFCALYDFIGERFVLMGDEQYNYTRQETPPFVG